VLSIGKLAAGQAKYYLDQAEGRVDVVQSVGDGVEDYYVGATEARGRWMGAGAIGLGLAGAVSGERLREVLEGRDSDGRSLRESSSGVRVAGFDLTFSAPKSVSVVFGIGDDQLRAAVRGADDRAVGEAVAYLERSAAAVRRGHGGLRVERADGLAAAAFRHRTSRVGDPQLHTHVLVANLARGPDGRWSALDGRQLYSHARAASFVYQAVLRSELTRELGLAWLPVRQGIAELAGVPKPVLRSFSRRRAEIEAAMEEHGTSGARAAEAAALATRSAKRDGVDASELVVGWRSRAAELGFEHGDFERLLGRVRAVDDAVPWERVLDALAAPTGLTWRASTFSRRDVVQALCEELPAGARFDARAVEAAADRFLASSRAVALLPESNAGEAFRRRDGRVLPVAREELRYSTPELLALEQRLVEPVLDSSGAGVGVAGVEDVQEAIARRSTLSGEQRAMVGRLCSDGDGVSVVVGKAGTGKTFALGAAREAWQAAGYPVIGVAVARRAARELEDGAGIANTSVTALLGDLATRGPAALPERCVLVVDEAGMVPTRPLAKLVDSAAAVGGKLVLVGDHRQLPEIEAGGAFRGLVHRGLAVTLSENRRQVHVWERTALDHLREGRPGQALTLYQAHDRIRVDDTQARSCERLVEDWWRAGDPQRAVMIAQRRVDVEDLNQQARERMRDAGLLGERELRLPGGRFAAGDHVVAKRNDLQRGIANGDRARVSAVDRDSGRLALDCRGERVVDADYLHGRTAHGDPTLRHGYAITTHVAQGLTVDRAFVLAGDAINRESAYTALSRGRHSNHLYLSRDTDGQRVEIAPADPHRVDPVARVTTALEKSFAASLAIDTGRVEPERALSGRIAEAERAHGQAADARQALEATRTRWLPGRRRQLAELRRTEVTAARLVRDLRRQQLELGHGARPFVTEHELDARSARTDDMLAERRRQRAHERGHDRGLGL
jgi:conjugative relaxase-like TrwC/TraI family protein